MKKILCFVLAAFITLTAFCGCGSNNAAVEKYGTDTLKIFLPGTYLGDGVIDGFEKEYGVKVVIELFDSNEMMYTKIQSGSKYDVLIPSDYMVERLVQEDLLEKLDKTKLNISGFSDKIPYGSYEGYDMSDYGVPYFWGSVGIVYNKTTVAAEDIAAGYEIFRNTKYNGKIYMYDSERDSFMMAFKALGYSMNTTDENEIEEAYKWLCDVDKNMSPSYVTDEVIDNMVNGIKDIALVYSGDAAYILSENENMAFVMPENGTNLWCDYMVVTKDCQCKDLAYDFISYISSYDTALKNSEGVGYTSPVAKVNEDLSKEGAIYYNNNAFIIRDKNEKDEVFMFNKEMQKKLSDLWIKVKAD